MPAPWTRAYVEVYGPGGYEGRWEAEPEPGGFDEAFRDATLADLRTPQPEYPDAHAERLDCGTDLVFGFWHHGARPSGPPRHTRPRTDRREFDRRRTRPVRTRGTPVPPDHQVKGARSPSRHLMSRRVARQQVLEEHDLARLVGVALSASPAACVAALAASRAARCRVVRVRSVPTCVLTACACAAVKPIAAALALETSTCDSAQRKDSARSRGYVAVVRTSAATAAVEAKVASGSGRPRSRGPNRPAMASNAAPPGLENRVENAPTPFPYPTSAKNHADLSPAPADSIKKLAGIDKKIAGAIKEIAGADEKTESAEHKFASEIAEKAHGTAKSGGVGTAITDVGGRFTFRSSAVARGVIRTR